MGSLDVHTYFGSFLIHNFVFVNVLESISIIPALHSSTQVAVASVKETGRDLDHCHALIKKFEDFEKDLSVDKDYMDQVKTFAQKLIGQDHSGTPEIKGLVVELDER